MEITTNQTTSQDAEPILQLKRPLLPIGEYAAQKGLSRDIIEQCGKLGLVQIRKHKGKTFVVDVPVSPSLYSYDATEEPTQPTAKTPQAEKISKLVKKAIPADHVLSGSQQIRPLELYKTHNEPAPAADEITRTESPPGLIQTPELEISETTDEPTETKKTSESTPITQNNRFHLGILTAQTRSERTWRLTAVLSLILLFAVALANLWLYIDRKIQLDRLDLAHNHLAQASQHADTLQNELSSFETKFRHIQNEQDISEAEIKNMRNELTQARQRFEAIQQHNSEAVSRLNEQIRKLTTQLIEPAENPQTPPDPDI